jgi:pimeloyl-ACP methyl ester carboxylesterase
VTPPRVLFLPGAAGDPAFWEPVASRLRTPHEPVLLAWPGLGHIPSRPGVESLDDLVEMTLAHMDRPVALVAQSMGGVVAVQAALARPAAVDRLVLVATSGGVDLTRFHVQDWRGDYQREYPRAAPWIRQARVDLDARLPSIEAPVLLLWGDADPISPVAVGEYLVTRFPKADLLVVGGGADHGFARDRADEVAPHIERHLFDR